MTPLPKRRHSSRRQAKRSRALHFEAAVLVGCKQCNALILPHRVCDACGYYDGKQIIVKKEKAKQVAK